MQTKITQNSNLSEEIKALLILLLLKSGTPSDEIQLALQIAGGEFVFKPGPKDSATVCSQAEPKSKRLRPKEIFRNSQLAPLQCYAA